MARTSSPASHRTASYAVVAAPHSFLQSTRAYLGRHTLLVWVCSAFAFNLVWYGVFLAFPLIDEDAAANYSSLVEAVRYADWSIYTFPIKWLEGLGQANAFEPLAFDPFAWIMLLWPASADAFRVSYAIRATTCWLGTYLFVANLFRGARGLAVASAWLSVLVNFTLANANGSPTFAGITVATQVALLPVLLWLYLRVVTARGLVNPASIAFVLVLVVFLLSYPLQSALGLAVVVVFAGSYAIVGPGAYRAAAWRGLAKLVGLSSFILFAPWVGVYWTWSALGITSARLVFADELATYPLTSQPPYFWHDVPAFLRVVIIIALGVMIIKRTPRPLQSVVLTVASIVCVTQLETFARNVGAINGWLERLPRPHYAEFYLPPFYAAIAAYVLFRWSKPLSIDRTLAVRVGALLAATRLVTERWDIALGACLVLVGGPLVMRASSQGFRPALRRFQAAAPAAVVFVLFVGAGATWQFTPEQIHPIFGQELLCHERAPWCQDAPGRTMGAASSTITEYLTQALPQDGVFRGRADYLLTPGLKLSTFPLDLDSPLSEEELQMLNRWYARAISLQDPSAPIRQFTFDERSELIRALLPLAPAGLLAEDSVVEIVDWIHAQRPERIGNLTFYDWQGDSELEAVVRERVRNYRATGNAMLQRALPFQGIPIASSYEQSLDYLYYLLWTRYLNEGFPARRSINMTEVEQLRDARLALVGVRLLVTRDVPMRPTNSDLTALTNRQGYTVLEIPDANTNGYAVTGVEYGADLEAELTAMRRVQFDPRRTVVLPEASRVALDSGPALSSSLVRSSITFAGQALHFTASSAGRSLVVLPYKFSNCWAATWFGPPGRVLRADVGLVGVMFDGDVDVSLRWTAGYVGGTDCLRQDAALIPQAQVAAERMN